jgi:translocation and assembly module TamA
MGRAWAAVLLVGLLTSAAAAQAQVTYEPAIEGVSDGGLASLLESVSELFRLREEPPDTVLGLRRRAEGDVERLTEALRAEGYYAGVVKAAIEEGEGEKTVRLIVEPGPPYLLSKFDVVLPADAPETAESVAAGLTPQALELKLGERAEAAKVVSATTEATARFGRNGHPFAELVRRRAVVDHAARTMAVELAIDPGPFVRFGETTIEGLDRVETEAVRRELAWRPGEPFDTRKTAATRQTLSATRLFSSITLDWPDAPGPDGRLPVRLHVEEAEHRTIGAGVSYSTSEGPGSKVYWSHGNLLGAGERLRLEGVLAEQRQGATATFRRPWFLDHRDQALELAAEVEHEAVEAYEADTARISAIVERKLTERLKVSGGLAYEHSVIEEEGGRRRSDDFDLVDAPLSLAYDGADDLLNPRRGWRASLAVTPTVGVLNTDSRFVTIAPEASYYFPIDGEARHVLALRGQLGAILGESRSGIPASRRLYAGGGDTVRGYAFQLVGPLDENDDPIGGTSLVAASIELRSRIYGDFGAVAFIDAGNVYEGSTPEFNEGVRVGAGVGLRYYTPVGPLRLDVAVPLDKREVDDDFQIYVSFGQAF